MTIIESSGVVVLQRSELEAFIERLHRRLCALRASRERIELMGRARRCDLVGATDGHHGPVQDVRLDGSTPGHDLLQPDGLPDSSQDQKIGFSAFRAAS